MNEKILSLLKSARTSKQFTQKFVAEKLGVKGNTIGNYENGITEPDIDTFVKLCNLYEINYSDVLETAFGHPQDENNISIHEKELIKKYRQLTAEQQGAVENNIDYFIQVNKKDETTENGEDPFANKVG